MCYILEILLFVDMISNIWKWEGCCLPQLLPVGWSPPRHPGLYLLPTLGLVEEHGERKSCQFVGESQQRSSDRDSSRGPSCRTGKLPVQQFQVVRLLRCQPPAEPIPVSYSNNLSTLLHGSGSRKPIPASWNPHSVLGTALGCNEQSISSRY